MYSICNMTKPFFSFNLLLNMVNLINLTNRSGLILRLPLKGEGKMA